MTYHARGIGAAESTPEAARWYKLTPSVISFLTSAYPNDSGVRAMIGRVATEGPVYMGVTSDDLYYLTSRSTGNIGGVYREPIGVPPLTYAQVLQVFEIANPNGPKKIVPTPTSTPFAPAATAPQPAPQAQSKLGLYAAIGLGGLATLGTGYVAYKHFKGR